MLECSRYRQAANWSEDGRGRARRTSWVRAQTPKGKPWVLVQVPPGAHPGTSVGAFYAGS